ncbi:uncharacterized protein DSM5745_03947 [Aspergillus mulundensis]|uniref:Uncharacterized protein n=1 Tax=Aspergillus mulundensis TaxID=1810919 RepID=A0A3D8SBQ9_9EURO|nr:hypothetical protein DSM5745_03947 [Aspergillus mulundensis]RDW83621.1 hypothetical protein DSM5745_03947 [Aspergillus mulundensis]
MATRIKDALAAHNLTRDALNQEESIETICTSISRLTIIAKGVLDDDLFGGVNLENISRNPGLMAEMFERFKKWVDAMGFDALNFDHPRLAVVSEYDQKYLVISLKSMYLHMMDVVEALILISRGEEEQRGPEYTAQIFKEEIQPALMKAYAIIWKLEEFEESLPKPPLTSQSGPRPEPENEKGVLVPNPTADPEKEARLRSLIREAISEVAANLPQDRKAWFEVVDFDMLRPFIYSNGMEWVEDYFENTYKDVLKTAVECFGTGTAAAKATGGAGNEYIYRGDEISSPDSELTTIAETEFDGSEDEAGNDICVPSCSKPNESSDAQNAINVSDAAENNTQLPMTVPEQINAIVGIFSEAMAKAHLIAPTMPNHIILNNVEYYLRNAPRAVHQNNGNDAISSATHASSDDESNSDDSNTEDDDNDSDKENRSPVAEEPETTINEQPVPDTESDVLAYQMGLWSGIIDFDTPLRDPQTGALNLSPEALAEVETLMRCDARWLGARAGGSFAVPVSSQGHEGSEHGANGIINKAPADEGHLPTTRGSLGKNPALDSLLKIRNDIKLSLDGIVDDVYRVLNLTQELDNALAIFEDSITDSAPPEVHDTVAGPFTTTAATVSEPPNAHKYHLQAAREAIPPSVDSNAATASSTTTETRLTDASDIPDEDAEEESECEALAAFVEQWDEHSEAPDAKENATTYDDLYDATDDELGESTVGDLFDLYDALFEDESTGDEAETSGTLVNSTSADEDEASTSVTLVNESTGTERTDSPEEYVIVEDGMELELPNGVRPGDEFPPGFIFLGSTLAEAMEAVRGERLRTDPDFDHRW